VALGVGQASPPTLDDVIQQAKALLDQNLHSLKLAATTDPQLDDSNVFFVDGLGTLCDTDPSTKERVLKLFGPGISRWAIVSSFVAHDDILFRVVFGNSGSGKTRLLAEGLCQYWGLYFTPDPLLLGSKDFSLSLGNLESYVEEGGVFSPIIPNSPISAQKSLQLNRAMARTTFRHILLARLLVLEAFLSAGADVPATHLRRRWTHLQLVPSALTSQFSSNQSDIFERVYRIIAQCRASDELRLLSLLDTIRQDSRVDSNSPFFIILDEARLCSHLYEGAFYSEKETGPEGIRSVLREISVTWERLSEKKSLAMIYSGTGFSLTRMLRYLASSIGAPTISRIFTNTGALVSQEQQSAYIMRHVTLEADNEEEVLSRAWRWLRGR